MWRQHVRQTASKLLAMTGLMISGSCLSTSALASDPLRVSVAAGELVPDGDGTFITSVGAGAIGEGGHVAVGIIAGDARFSGLYLLGPDGALLNRSLSEEALPGQSGPSALSISPSGTVAVGRRPPFGISANNSFFLLHPDGTRTNFGALGATFAGAGARVISGLPIVHPYAYLFPEIHDNRPNVGLVSLSPVAIGNEFINAALVRFNLDGSMTPLVFDGNVPGAQLVVSWPRDVSSDGAVLYTSSLLNVPGSNALRIWRNGVVIRVLGTRDPHPTLPDREIVGYGAAQLNSQGDVLIDCSSRDLAGQVYTEDLLWLQAGVWRRLPQTWTFSIDGRSVVCEPVAFTLLDDGSALFTLTFRLPLQQNSRLATARVMSDGSASLLTYDGQPVQSRDGSIGIYGLTGRLPPVLLRDPHVASIRVGSTTQTWVVVRDTDGDLVSLAAPGDTFTHNGLAWTITRIFNSAAAGSNVLISALAVAPGQAEIHFVLTTTVAGPSCGDLEFNNDGVWPSDQDIIDFFNVFSGAPCPTLRCDTIDFNRNGVYPEEQDVVDFLSVLAGGTCGT